MGFIALFLVDALSPSCARQGGGPSQIAGSRGEGFPVSLGWRLRFAHRIRRRSEDQDAGTPDSVERRGVYT
jgi:hypothetical protein